MRHILALSTVDAVLGVVAGAARRTARPTAPETATASAVPGQRIPPRALTHPAETAGSGLLSLFWSRIPAPPVGTWESSHEDCRIRRLYARAGHHERATDTNTSGTAAAGAHGLPGHTHAAQWQVARARRHAAAAARRDARTVAVAGASFGCHRAAWQRPGSQPLADDGWGWSGI